MKIGNKIMVHAYKKNGWLYRTWEFPLVVENNSDYACLFLKNSWVTTSEKDSSRHFHSAHHNDSLWFFFKEQWFNIIATINENKIQYYINIASPYVFEEEAIKYIDFDYDIKVKNNGLFTVVDIEEFERHKERFNYGRKLSRVIDAELEKINSEEKIKELRKQLSKTVLKDLLKRADMLIEKNKKVRGF